MMAAHFARALRNHSTAAHVVRTRLTYPVRPPTGWQNGRLVTTTHWEKIGDIFPQERWTGDNSLLHDEEDERELEVHDARKASRPLTLERNGFELRSWPSAVTDFYDDDSVRSSYYEETAALVTAATGAKDVLVFQHMRRDSELHNKETAVAGMQNQRHAAAHGAVQRVHADYTKVNGPQKLRQLEEEGVVPAGLAAGRPWSVVNVWRSIDEVHPVQSLPLAVLDASTVSADDTFTYALVMNEVSPPLVGFNNGVGFCEEHRWYYYSQMTHDEALLFYTYDGTFQSAQPRFVFHTAIDTGTGTGTGAGTGHAVPRKSIECRCLAIF